MELAVYAVHARIIKNMFIPIEHLLTVVVVYVVLQKQKLMTIIIHCRDNTLAAAAVCAMMKRNKD